MSLHPRHRAGERLKWGSCPHLQLSRPVPAKQMAAALFPPAARADAAALEQRNKLRLWSTHIF